MTLSNIRQVSYGGRVRHEFFYSGVADADAWYTKMRAKEVYRMRDGERIEEMYLPEHTVEDIANPDHAKELRMEVIKSALDDDDFKDLVIALGFANIGAIPDALKAKVQAAKDA